MEQKYSEGMAWDFFFLIKLTPNFSGLDDFKSEEVTPLEEMGQCENGTKAEI